MVILFSIAFPPIPFSTKPKSSIAQISAIVKQSCTSAISISFGFILACLYAILAADTVESNVQISLLPCNESVSDAWPEAIIFIGLSE